MQAHARAGGVAVDQAGFRRKVRKPGAMRGALGQLCEQCGHGGPGLVALRVLRAVAIAVSIRYPAVGAATTHGRGHRVAAGGDLMTKGRLRGDLLDGGQQGVGIAQGKAFQQPGVRADLLLCRWLGRAKVKQALHGGYPESGVAG